MTLFAHPCYTQSCLKQRNQVSTKNSTKFCWKFGIAKRCLKNGIIASSALSIRKETRVTAKTTEESVCSTSHTKSSQPSWLSAWNRMYYALSDHTNVVLRLGRSLRRPKNTRSIRITSSSILGKHMTLQREMSYTVQWTNLASQRSSSELAKWRYGTLGVVSKFLNYSVKVMHYHANFK